jgi:GT2 family glycosyltransferase
VNEKNEGFGNANNIGLTHCKGKYVLLLNPDTIVTEEALKDCIEFMDEHADVGATGVRMLDGSGNFLAESKRSFPSAKASFYKLTGLSVLFKNSATLNKYALGNKEEKGIYEVPVLCGACMMIRREVMQQLNGFDKDFFMYGEDIDLSYRINKAGFKNYYIGSATIIHFKGESSKRFSLHFIKMFYHAMILFVQKHYKHSFFSRSILYTGIYLRAGVALLLLPFKYFFSSNNKSFNNTSVYFLGSPQDINCAKKILHNTTSTIISNKVQPSSLQKSDIFFCLGDTLTYPESILLMEQFKNRKNTFKWFGKNTECILGSADKKTQGKVHTVD